MSRLVIVCGLTGAGKTSYSIGLCEELEAIRFSIDPWMQTLFAKDMESLDFSWMMERVERCQQQIWDVASQILVKKGNVLPKETPRKIHRCIRLKSRIKCLHLWSPVLKLLMKRSLPMENELRRLPRSEFRTLLQVLHGTFDLCIHTFSRSINDIVGALYDKRVIHF